VTIKEREVLDGLLTGLTELRIAIIGNGTKGLSERVGDLEQKHSPPSRMEIMKRRALEVALMGFILSGVTLILKVTGVI